MTLKAVGVAIGLAFGFIVGWARLTDYDVIRDMLLLRHPDVFLLMMSAMATSAIGARLLRALQVRSVLDGVELHDGQLRAQFEGSSLRLEELTFQGGTGSRAYVSGISGNRTQPPGARGSMRANGRIDWSGISNADAGDSGIRMDL